jgi:hypothetical protein
MNVAVMVVDDEDMFVPRLGYRIHGSIGFPVLSALGRITFFANGRFRAELPASAARPAKHNLFLEKLNPIVTVRVGGTEQLFTIDTGATGTFLSAAFYREHKAEFASRPAGELELTGAGGSVRIPAYQKSELLLSIGGHEIVLRNVPVLTDSPDALERKFYGNLGQDALKRFRSYTFDFKKMTFVVD